MHECTCVFVSLIDVGSVSCVTTANMRYRPCFFFRPPAMQASKLCVMAFWHEQTCFIIRAPPAGLLHCGLPRTNLHSTNPPSPLTAPPFTHIPPYLKTRGSPMFSGHNPCCVEAVMRCLDLPTNVQATSCLRAKQSNAWNEAKHKACVQRIQRTE